MAVVYLVRHGHADYAEIDGRGWPGATADYAPLSDLGFQQARQAAQELAQVGAVELVSSPMTRALQTAGILASRLRLPVHVQFDLREWLPDDQFLWRGHADVRAAVADFDRCAFEWPPGERRSWEPLSAVRARAETALRAATKLLAADDIVIAVCHEMVIWSLTGERSTGTGKWRRIELS